VIATAAKVAVLAQPDGDMIEKGLGQFRLIEEGPNLEHDSVGQALLAKATYRAALHDQLRGPLKCGEEVSGPECFR
jgi:hypothetical protein